MPVAGAPLARGLICTHDSRRDMAANAKRPVIVSRKTMDTIRRNTTSRNNRAPHIGPAVKMENGGAGEETGGVMTGEGEEEGLAQHERQNADGTTMERLLLPARDRPHAIAHARVSPLPPLACSLGSSHATSGAAIYTHA